MKPRLLQHHAEAAAQAPARHVPHVHAIDPYTPAINIIEPHQQIYDSCFSASGRSYDRDALTGLHLEIEILYQLLLGIVGEVYILHRDVSLGLCQDCRALRIRDLRLLLDKLKHPAGTCKRCLELRHHAGNLIKRLRVLVRVAQKAGELADTDAPPDG